MREITPRKPLHFILLSIALLYAAVLLLAPIVEELLFRGILQQWLNRLFSDHTSSVTGPDPESPPGPTEDDNATWEPAEIDGTPEVVALSPERDALARNLPVWLSIGLTSMIFAFLHLDQWPAPIAIFILSVWLGTVFRRSRSLITVMALHATFNGFSTIGLLLEALNRRIHPEGPQAAITLASRFLNVILGPITG